jgi:hypothetical protein
MDCKSCSEDLTAYLDGELVRSRFREVEGHLEGCLPCLEELESLKRSVRLVESNLPEFDPAPEIWNRLTDEISAGRDARISTGLLHRLRVHRWTAATVALAASILLAVGVWGIWNRMRSEDALRRYMIEYVQKRESQERAERARMTDIADEIRTADAVHLEYLDNPFVEISEEQIENPFRSEAQ